MPAKMEQLERQAAKTRARLAKTLDALRFRMTPVRYSIKSLTTPHTGCSSAISGGKFTKTLCLWF
jgi:hypothetical protein